MAERNYWVLCDDGCKFPAMTAEQVLAAIAEATGNTVTDIDSAFITTCHQMQHFCFTLTQKRAENCPLAFYSFMCFAM